MTIDHTIACRPGSPGIILCMLPSNERRRYSVTPSFIGWAHTQNDPCSHYCGHFADTFASLWSPSEIGHQDNGPSTVRQVDMFDAITFFM